MPHPRLLVHAIRTRAKDAPDSPWLLYAKSTNWKENGYNSITWKQFFSAISKSAFWLDENIPRKTAGRQTFAYRGPSDARYYILMVAAAISERTVSLLCCLKALFIFITLSTYSFLANKCFYRCSYLMGESLLMA